jgi:hypothetical protein
MDITNVRFILVIAGTVIAGIGYGYSIHTHECSWLLFGAGGNMMQAIGAFTPHE